MYATGCRYGKSTIGNVQIYKGSTYIDQFTFSDQLGYGYQYYPTMTAGTYTLKFKATWTAYDVKDYTVSIYSANSFKIYDSYGRTSTDDVDL